MKKYLLILTFLVTYVTFSQQDAWVYFNDKPNSAAFFSNPLSELSQRALDRRTAQNITLVIKQMINLIDSDNEYQLNSYEHDIQRFFNEIFVTT